MRRWIEMIDSLSDTCGRVIAWLTLFMVLVTLLVVVLRYLFDFGWIWLQESVTWMHAAVFMLGAAYTLRHEEHVRVDVFYRRRSVRGQAWIDVFGALLFLLPMCGFLLWASLDYVSASWALKETSREAGGLPYPLVPLMKTLIPATAVLLLLQGMADLLRNVAVLRGRALPRRAVTRSSSPADAI